MRVGSRPSIDTPGSVAGAARERAVGGLPTTPPRRSFDLGPRVGPPAPLRPTGEGAELPGLEMPVVPAFRSLETSRGFGHDAAMQTVAASDRPDLAPKITSGEPEAPRPDVGEDDEFTDGTPSLDGATSTVFTPAAGGDPRLHAGLSEADRVALDRIVTFAALTRLDGLPSFQIGLGSGPLANTSLTIRRLADRRIAVQVSRMGGGGSLIGDPGLHAMVQALESRGISVVLEIA